MERDIINELFGMREESVAKFSAALIPNIDSERVIGIRLPKLRAYAKTFSPEQRKDFFDTLPHHYLEEDHLHSFLIAGIKDFEECIAETERFLPFIDNWASCDSLRPACFKKRKKELLAHIENWLESDLVYTKRFAIGMLMCHFLDDDFSPEYLEWVKGCESEEYYLNMMRAWFFATALAKQYESVLPLIEARELDKFTQNKTIQKACESFRVSAEHKQHLKRFKI